MASALRIASILAALSAPSACHRQSLVESPADRRVANLHAFGRLYGVVRWFHPSDTAASTDWDDFAIEGVRRVIGASDARDLQAALGALFQRVAPTVVVVGPGEPWPAAAPPPADASHLELVSWQHEGFGESSFIAGTFASKRTHRDRIAAVAGAPYGMLWQAVDATPFRGATVRIRGKLRVARPGRATLWLRVERDTETRFSEEMRERPVVSTTWQSAEITGPVVADATRIVFGPRTQGRGASWYDDLELAVQRTPGGAWTPIAIDDAGFEDPTFTPSWHPGIEGQLVVTTTATEAIRRGDVIITVDGKPALQQLAEDEALISGSDHWRAARASERFGAGPAGRQLVVRLRRDTTELEVTAPRGPAVSERLDLPPIHRFDDGVYYVDLDRALMPEIDAAMEALARAPGVVFDLRDRPQGNHLILSHLLTEPFEGSSFIAIPQVIRPDHVANAIASWDRPAPFPFPVLEPHIQGKVAFLTGPQAASYSESVMSVVEGRHLGAIVGAATAGTNGAKAEVTDPSGCRTTFTGARVTKLDGSRFHLVGVLPTIPASRTIAGVRAGRDEVLEAGLAYARSRN